jgi:N-acetylmuramoyl-L-alanine amidase
MIKYKALILLLLMIIPHSTLFDQNFEYLSAKPRRGDGLYLFFQRYAIPYTQQMQKKFRAMNHGKFGKNGVLLLHNSYQLPIHIRTFNGKTIRSSINNNDYNYAKMIEQYNDRMHRLGVKSEDFRKDRILWIPLFKVTETTKLYDNKVADNEPSPVIEKNYDIFGKDHKKVIIKSNELSGCIYYLVCGHGGPDPGAIGRSGGFELHEDEYAYDVTFEIRQKITRIRSRCIFHRPGPK